MIDKRTRLELARKARELTKDWPRSKKMQKKFIAEYARTGFTDGAKAAERAGYANPRESASNNLRKHRPVRVAVDTLKRDIEEAMLSDVVADAVEILSYLTSVMRGEEVDETLRGVGEGYQDITELKVNTSSRLQAAKMLWNSLSMETKELTLARIAKLEAETKLLETHEEDVEDNVAKRLEQLGDVLDGSE